MEKRILLTGSNGLLGQKIVSQLSERNHISLMATSRGINRHPEWTGYQYEDVDMLDAEKWDEIFEDFEPTDVINTAAITQVDKCETEREICDQVNVEAVKRLSALCAKYGSHLVHISTDFVFDGENGPYQEKDPTGPVNYYGQSKLKAEQVILESGVSASILRTMLLYGITPSMSRSNIVLWVKKSLEAGKPIRVVNDQFRCPTLAEDLATATISAVMYRAKGIYHISGAEMMSILDLAYKVADFWELDKELISQTDSISLNQPARRPPKTGFILIKAQTELDYKPHSLIQGLQIVDQQMRDLP